MRHFLLIILTTFFANDAFAQGVTKNGEETTTGAEYINKNGAIGSANGVNKNGQVVSAVTIPTVTTTAISAITSNTAASGVTVISDGGATVTTGICWSTAANPTTELSPKTTDGTGSITGLTLGTTYYVRAYATNSAGTGYGNELSFTTALAVGEAYQGGKIAYILTSGDAGYIAGETHGLIVSLDVLGISNWHFPVVYLGTTDDDGKTNTALIVADQNNTDPNKYSLSAGERCADYSVVGTDGVTYDDWYLPSKTELFSIRGQLSAPYSEYWSSTEIVGTENAYKMRLDGTFLAFWKRNGTAVRAVRSF